MPYIPPPETEFLQGLVHAPRRERERRWKNADGDRIYVWDGLHGELEVYNARGRHIGVIDPQTGAIIKPAVPGRRIDV